MAHSDDLHLIQTDPDDKVFSNVGMLRFTTIAKSRDENRALLASLFDHLGKWFGENQDSLALSPQLDGESYQIVTETLSEATEDTFPEEWAR